MLIRYTTWSLTALLLGSVAVGYGAPLPKNGPADPSPAPTAKAAPKKPSDAAVHTMRASAKHPLARRVVVVHAQLAPTPSRISEIQTALSREGAYQGEPSGKWDPTTVDAMRQFQNDHGLNPSGKIDALTLQKLGLGSQVSGMGAPLPLAVPQASNADGSQQTERP